MQITNNQNYADAVAQETGTIESLFEQCIAKGASITDLPTLGDVVETKELKDKKRQQSIIDNKVTIGTNGAGELMTGIGYWAIEEDFEVQ